MILSENPIHDSGGGQRSAQIALELLERDACVVYVSRGEVTETVDLGLVFDQPRLVTLRLAELLAPDARGPLTSLLERPGAAVLTQVPVEAWQPVLALARASGAVTVYDCVDPWGSELGRGWYSRRSEQRVARESDLLVATAPALVEHVEALAERETRLLPNAFDPRRFRPDRSYPRPPDLPEADRIALFVGALWGRWLDWGLVRRAVEGAPGTRFVFIGDRRREGRGLPDRCTFLGLKANAELPAYLAHAEVAFLPWRHTPMTDAMSPITVYEHLAMGLPVVAPPLDTLHGLPHVVPAADPDAFAAAVAAVGRAALTPAEREAMRARAAVSSWTARVDTLLELVETARPRRAAAPGVTRAGPVVKSRATLSVVVPSYNHARFLGEAVDSVRDQTLPAGELLVIDDGSSDESLDVLADHAFPGMRFIAQRNRGAHATINRAIAISEGDYVAILNSDDAFEPARLEHAWAVAAETGAALVVGSVRLVDSVGSDLPADHPTVRWYGEARTVVGEARTLAEGARRENVAVTTSNFFLHRELWRRLGGFAAYRYVHDFDFLLRALELCPDRVAYVDEIRDVRYRVHEDNTIAENVERALAERARMLRELDRLPRRARAALLRRRSRRALADAIASAPLPAPVGATVEVGEPHPTVGLVVPSLDTGGLEEVVGLLAQALPAEGVRVGVLCTGTGGALVDRLRDAGVPVTVGGGDEHAWRAWLRDASPDVLSTHAAEARAVEVLAEGGLPVVETVHNTYAWITEEGWARERAKASRLRATIAVSPLVARYYADRCREAPPAVVVPNAVHPARASRAPRAWARRRLRVDEASPLFVHHGRLTYQKNVPTLLRAFAALLETLPSARLLLVGPVEDEEELARLRETHRTPFDRGAVRHLPSVWCVGTVLSAADAYVTASYFEGWSVAASEALWVGTPVILTECGGAPELVGPDGARGHLVPSPIGDPLAATPELVLGPPEETLERTRAALTGAMAEVAADRPGWQERREEIRAHARGALAPGRMAADYARILKEVAGAS